MKRNCWKVVGEVLIVIFTILAGLSAAGIWLFPDFDPFGQKEGELADPSDMGQYVADQITLAAFNGVEVKHRPHGNNLPTTVTVPNIKSGQCLVCAVEFYLRKRLRTPQRTDLTSHLPLIVVNFEKRHYQKEHNRFRLVLRTPQPIAGKEWAALKIAIVEPRWVGNTYIGDVVLHYNHTKRATIRGVEIDVLSEKPKLDE